jgi:tRNA-specific 2-thiouridylase
VAGKDLGLNVLTVVQGDSHPLLFTRSLRIANVHWINREKTAYPLRITAKTRYRQADQACVVEQDNSGWNVTFSEPQRAVTPGQSCVFYSDERCLGGGVIEATE